MGRLFIVALAVGISLVAAAQVRGDDRDKALAIVNRAMRAHGGEDRLANLKVIRRSSKGAIYVLGKELPSKDDLVLGLPDRLRWELDLDASGQKVQVTLVINKDKGWRVTGGAAVEVGKDELEDLREEIYVAWVITLAPVTNRTFDLAPLPEIQVNGKPATGVGVTHKGHADIKLYFDNETNLLAKVERRAREVGLPVKKESFLSGYKSFSGIQFPTKVLEYTDGKKAAEIFPQDYKLPSGLDENTFSKP